MLKTLTTLAVVCIAVVAMPAHNQVISNQTSSQRQQDAQKTPTPSVAPITNNQTTAYYQQESKDKPQGWQKLIAWPDGITALAIVLTLFAIIWQSVGTQLSVRAARNSIVLQEMGYIQWVYLTNWRVTFDEERQQMKIHVEILNQTEFPLTLNSARLVFGTKPNIMTVTLGEDFFLAPKLPYPVDVGLHVYNDQIKAFDIGYYGIDVEGSIMHIGVLRRQQTQEIGGILVAGRDTGARFDAYIPMHPKAPTPTDNA